MSEEKKNEILDQAKALDDQELSDVAGGKQCYCAIGGGGVAEQHGKTCACAVVGAGEYGSEVYEEMHEWVRCSCGVYGYGDSYETGLEKKNKGK